MAAASVLGACTGPFSRSQPDDVRAVRIDAVVRGDVVNVVMHVRFASDDGGEVAVLQQPWTQVSELTRNGEPVPGGGRSQRFIKAGERETTLSFTFSGGVERAGESVTATVPVWGGGFGSPFKNEPVPVSGTVVVEGATGPVDARWHRRVDGAVTIGEAGRVSFEGTVDVQSTSRIDMAAGTGPAIDEFRRRQESFDRADGEFRADAEGKVRREDLANTAYWIVVGLEVALPLLFTLRRVMQGGRRRLRGERDVPREISEPPGTEDPAIVALLRSGGHDIDGAAVAGTILDLAHRGVVDIDGLASQHYRVRVEGGAVGATPAENAVLDMLRAAAGPDGVVEGPPLTASTKGPWWRAYRRDVARRAHAAGVVQQRFRSAGFRTSVVLLVITTAPQYVRSPEVGIAVAAVAAVLFMLPSMGGFVLTEEGWRARARWLAFRRYIEPSTGLDVSGPAGVAVWGPYLAYGAALGAAETAASGLTPRTRRRWWRLRGPSAGAASVVLLLLACATVAGAAEGMVECAVGSKKDARAQLEDGSGRRVRLDLACQDLSNMDLVQMDLRGADLRRADLHGADLGQAHLDEADLRQADLHDADLSQADFPRADLRKANLRGADVGQATFARADLREANLDNADLTQARLEEADFTDASLRNADLTQASVEDAIFVRADLTGADNVPSLRGLDTTGAVGLPGVRRGQVLRWVALAAAAVVVLAFVARLVRRSRGISRELE